MPSELRLLQASITMQAHDLRCACRLQPEYVLRNFIVELDVVIAGESIVPRCLEKLLLERDIPLRIDPQHRFAEYLLNAGRLARHLQLRGLHAFDRLPSLPGHGE